MTLKGQAETALGAGLWFSAVGGLFGTLVMIFMAPSLAEVAIKFSSFEYFWLVVLGLASAVFIGSSSVVKALISLLLGLLVACIGLENPAGHPRFTFGVTDLLSGVELIPMMVGMFAVSEILRYMVDTNPPGRILKDKLGSVFTGMWTLTKKYRWSLLRGSALGTAVGIQPGAGADMAAWMSYAMSKRFSKEPEKFGTGHIEGIVESGAANNSAWPAPGSGAGVRHSRRQHHRHRHRRALPQGPEPGPSIFINNAPSVYAIFMVFILANIIMLPLGWACIKAANKVLAVPRTLLMPVVLLFCIVGAYAVNNSLFSVGVVLFFGVVAFVLEENGFPVAPAILGVVLGTMLEENFITSMIKSDGSPAVFFTRPIAGGLAIATFVILLWPVGAWAVRRLRGKAAA
jgi:TctA family transporter